jgi:hypothetical protein
MEYHTVLFGGGKYRVMTNALKRSIDANSEHSLTIHEITDKPGPGRIKLTTNSLKLKKWNEIVQEATDNVVLMDCDTILLKCISHVFEKDFDFAYTERTKGGHFPLNGGVVFVKPTKKSKEFFNEWLRVNDKMMDNFNFHRPWKKKYAGINQAALGYLLERKPELNILKVPCSKYNACDPVDWEDVSDAHVLHIKSDLQNQCFAKEPTRLKDAVSEWNKYNK